MEALMLELTPKAGVKIIDVHQRLEYEAEERCCETLEETKKVSHSARH